MSIFLVIFVTYFLWYIDRASNLLTASAHHRARITHFRTFKGKVASSNHDCNCSIVLAERAKHINIQTSKKHKNLTNLNLLTKICRSISV